MKTNRKGKIRLQRGDYRVGNFIFHQEPGHIKVAAISGIASWRVSLDTAVGMLVSNGIKEKQDRWLGIYAACVFSQLLVVTDSDFFAKHAELINAQAEAHPEFYGKQKPTDDKAKDDEILKEEKELQEELDKR